MNRKYFLFILQFLTSICIVSVGFASWTIVTPPIIEEGTISSEPVISADTYLDIDIDDVSYCEEGFVTDADGKIGVKELPWGEYYFVETVPAEGYVLENGVVKK